MDENSQAEIQYLGRKIKLHGQAVIGRSLESLVCIADPNVSREHAVVLKTENGWEIVDKSLNGFLVNGGRSSKGKSILLPSDKVSLILIDGSSVEHKILFRPLHGCDCPPPAKKLKLKEATNNSFAERLRESESQMLIKQSVLNDTLRDKNLEQSVLSDRRQEVEKIYQGKMDLLVSDYESRIRSLTERIELGEKLQSEKNQLEFEFAAEKEKLLAAREEERKDLEEKLKFAQMEVEKLQNEKFQIQQHFQAELEELKKKLEEQEKEHLEEKENTLRERERLMCLSQEEKIQLQAKIQELQEMLAKKEQEQKEIDEAQRTTSSQTAGQQTSFLLEPRMQDAELPVFAVEEVVVTTEEHGPSSSHSSATHSSAEPSVDHPRLTEIMEELQREREAREILEAAMKRKEEEMEEVLDSELTCSICSEIFVKPITLDCLHTFCYTCILRWEKNQKDCPMCRAKFQTLGHKNLIVSNCIDKFVERTLNSEAKAKRQELVRTREELEKTLLPSTSAPGGASGRASNAVQNNVYVNVQRLSNAPVTINVPARPAQAAIEAAQATIGAAQAAIEAARASSSAALRNRRGTPAQPQRPPVLLPRAPVQSQRAQAVRTRSMAYANQVRQRVTVSQPVVEGRPPQRVSVRPAVSGQPERHFILVAPRGPRLVIRNPVEGQIINGGVVLASNTAVSAPARNQAPVSEVEIIGTRAAGSSAGPPAR